MNSDYKVDNQKELTAEQKEQQSKRVLAIYNATLGVTNLIDEMQNETDDYFKTNWTVALNNLSYDMRHILSVMGEQNFSLDYSQAQTFMSYVRIFDYLINKMTDDLILYEEGMGTVKMIKKNLKLASKPYAAFVCSRVRDLGLVQSIAPKYLSMYKKYEEEGIDKLLAIDMSNVFDFTFAEEDDVYDDVYLDELKEDMTKMFGEEYNISDFEKISSILLEYSDKIDEESHIKLDF